MMNDIEKMKQEIKKMRAEIEERRRERVAKGLPPDPPAPFLPVAISAVLADRIEPVLPFLVKYAQLIQKAGKTLPVDTTKLQRYKDDADLLQHSEGTFLRLYGGCVYGAINTIESAVSKEISVTKAARNIYIDMSVLKDLRPKTGFDDVTYDEYKRLKNDHDLFEKQRNDYLKRGERNVND